MRVSDNDILEVLRTLEWTGWDDGGGQSCCPVCAAWIPRLKKERVIRKAHMEGCELADAIQELEGRRAGAKDEKGTA